MNSKLFLLAAASSFSMVGVAANYTNFIIINLDDAGYGDFSYNGAYGYKTPRESASLIFWPDNLSVALHVPDC